jgi:cyclopentanol dehydrogenase
MRHERAHMVTSQDHHEGLRAFPRHAMAWGTFHGDLSPCYTGAVISCTGGDRDHETRREGGADQRRRPPWDRVQDVNSQGVFLGTTHAIPEMRTAGGGSIINISSIDGLVGRAGATADHASKGAVRIFTKATAVQHARAGIRANSVHPGLIDTPMTERLRSDPERREDLVRRTPLGRIGVPADVASGVLFLASDESPFMTGSELVIDGGYTAP